MYKIIVILYFLLKEVGDGQEHPPSMCKYRLSKDCTGSMQQLHYLLRNRVNIDTRVKSLVIMQHIMNHRVIFVRD